MCEHLNFSCECDVNRLPTKEGGPIERFCMDVRVKCADCGLPFRFIGLPAGLDLNGAATSVDACEGRFAIAPKGQVVSVLEGGVSGFSIRNETPRKSAIPDDFPVLQGRRCPKCQGLMIHTRLGGYRCQLGCQ
jgi:hypothetical protein